MAAANRNQIFEHGSDGGGREGSLPALGSLCPSSSALPWGCLSFTVLGAESVCGAGCRPPFTFVSSILCPDVLEQSAGPVCCPGSWVGERALSCCCCPPVETIRRGGSTFPKQAGHHWAWPPGRVSCLLCGCCLFATSGMVQKVWTVLGQDRDSLGGLSAPTSPSCCDGFLFRGI